MKCYLEACIFNENRKCKLDEIYIDDIGMCSHCVNVDIYVDPLDKTKQKVSSRFDE